MSIKVYEDDIINCMTNYLKSKEYIIVLSGGKQAKLFYSLGESKRKSPDIIAIKNDVLLIVEAKIKSVDSFKMDKRGYSDYSSLNYILNNISVKNKIIEDVRRKIAKHGYCNNFNVITCILAGESYSRHKQKFIDNRICVANCNYLYNTITIENDIYNIL